MSIKTLSLIVSVFIVVQMAIVYAITRANKELFDGYKAVGYFRAIDALSKIKPSSALIIRLCYGASIFEVIFMMFAKYL